MAEQEALEALMRQAGLDPDPHIARAWNRERPQLLALALAARERQAQLRKH